MSETPISVVVGVGPGLGLAVAKRFARAGHRVLICARDQAKLDDLAEAQPQLIRMALDATDPSAVADVFTRIQAEHGPPECVVFNAGAFEPAGVTDIDPADFERCWRVGCFAGFLVGQQAARSMLEAGRGTILMTGATASLRGGPNFANLASPKFALRAVAQSMARELAPKNIHVAHIIIDGQIRAPRYEHLLDQRGADSLLEPDAIAETYWQLHNQHRSAWTFELDVRPWVEKF